MDVVAVMISRRRPGTELSDKPSACHNLQALPQHGNVLRRARRVLHDSNPWLPGESGSASFPQCARAVWHPAAGRCTRLGHWRLRVPMCFISLSIEAAVASLQLLPVWSFWWSRNGSDDPI